MMHKAVGLSKITQGGVQREDPDIKKTVWAKDICTTMAQGFNIYIYKELM